MLRRIMLIGLLVVLGAASAQAQLTEANLGGWFGSNGHSLLVENLTFPGKTAVVFGPQPAGYDVHCVERVGMHARSDIHAWFGPFAVKSRHRRSGAIGCLRFEFVVFSRDFRLVLGPMSDATIKRAIDPQRTSRCRSAGCTWGAPSDRAAI